MFFDHPTTDHTLELDPDSGLPVAVGSASSVGLRVVLRTEVEVVTGGVEQRSPTGGLDYLDTSSHRRVRRTGDATILEGTDARCVVVPVDIDGLRASLRYRFNRYGPAMSFGLMLAGPEAVVVRDVKMNAVAILDDGSGSDASWELTAPGNTLDGRVPLDRLRAEVGISPLGGLRGSSSLVHLQPASSGPAVAFWFDNDTEIPQLSISGLGPRELSWALHTNFAADLAHAAGCEIALLSVDLGCARWDQFPPTFATWLRARGLSTPGDPPAWISGAMIYEAQVGFSVFERVHRYAPYPEVPDLVADLDRIRAFGFTVIQLMPRQPYPSYNIHDYADIDVTYGPADEVRALVAACHQRGMKIIFDVLLHGVLDQESIGAAADGVRSGPFAALIDDGTSDSFSTDVNDWSNYLVAWSRHILDFEPYWKASSPPVSPLIAEHPEWFSRTSSGDIAGVYTKAFDARNRSWQRYFSVAMCSFVHQLDIDGFRFDAPTYNDFANWAPWARSRAGASALACTGLFERLRPELRAIKPDLLLYTEPSGHALRRSMDLNYNYDEQWLVTAIAGGADPTPWTVRSAKGLATWMRDRDAVLPPGSMTAHHIDSHDTFWWPSWGKKWRREQFGRDQFRLLALIFAALPGPYMMFAGGEEGIEDLLPEFADLKGDSVWRDGASFWWCGPDVPDEVFGLTRSIGMTSVSVAVNFADAPASCDDPVEGDASLLFSVGTARTGQQTRRVELGPYSALVVRRVRSSGE